MPGRQTEAEDEVRNPPDLVVLIMRRPPTPLTSLAKEKRILDWLPVKSMRYLCVQARPTGGAFAIYGKRSELLILLRIRAFRCKFSRGFLLRLKKKEKKGRICQKPS